jgi:hypothetical protein
MAIDDYFNTLLCVATFSEGTAPNYEPSYSLGDEFYGLIDKQSSMRIWSEKGSSIKIESKLFCSADQTVTENDRIIAIEPHTLVTADLGKYHKELGGAWTLTASAAIGDPVIFFGATTSAGISRQADGDIYTIYSKSNPNMMNRHLEILLQKVGE